jgi:Ser/Thr protein kinase RdoA (MazF antagonist)
VEVGDLLRDFARYLLPRGAGVQLAGCVEAAADAVSDALPALPSAVGHNDYHPRNVLLTGHGRPCIIDIFPAWEPALYEDVSTFLVGLSTVGPRLVTRGAAFPRRTVASYEADFLRGYFGSLEAIAVREVLAFQLLMTLDRWSWVASASFSGRARNVKTVARRQWALPVFKREVNRLVTQLLEASAVSASSALGKTDWL